MSILREEKVRFLLQLGGITVIAILAWWLWKTREEVRDFVRLKSRNESTIECTVIGPVVRPGTYALNLSMNFNQLSKRVGGLEKGYAWKIETSNRIETWVRQGTNNFLTISDLVFKPNRWDYVKDSEESARRTLRYR